MYRRSACDPALESSRQRRQGELSQASIEVAHVVCHNRVSMRPDTGSKAENVLDNVAISPATRCFGGALLRLLASVEPVLIEQMPCFPLCHEAGVKQQEQRGGH